LKRFILLTSGRAGSTSLMDALARFDDIVVPSKQIDCVDNEIFHPQRIRQYAYTYQQLSGIPVRDELSLMEAFYQSNQDAGFAGFKSMPNRHRSLMEVATSGKTKIITLTREDVASTVASFIMAIDADTWRRQGGAQPNRFRFTALYHERAFSHLAYIKQSIDFLHSLPNAIHVSFEDLCRPDFSHKGLDEYFRRRIALDNPMPPTSGAEYVDNWDEFVTFIEHKGAELDAKNVSGGRSET